MNPFLLFDFDGTVANSIDALFDLVNGLAPRYGYQPITRDRFESLRDLPLAKASRVLRVPLYKIAQAIPVVLHEYHRIIPDLDPCPGVPFLLDALRREGIRMALLSSNRADNLQAFLDNHRLNHFEWIEGTGGILHKHSSIKAQIRKHGLDPDEVLYVGDEVRDIKAARKSRVKVISVCWGLHSRANLSGHKPDHLVETPAEILDLVNHYLSKITHTRDKAI